MNLGGNSRLILRRGRPISNFFGAKARSNVPKGTFLTDCKSKCITTGLKICRHGTSSTQDSRPTTESWPAAISNRAEWTCIHTCYIYHVPGSCVHVTKVTDGTNQRKSPMEISKGLYGRKLPTKSYRRKLRNYFPTKTTKRGFRRELPNELLPKENTKGT